MHICWHYYVGSGKQKGESCIRGERASKDEDRAKMCRGNSLYKKLMVFEADGGRRSASRERGVFLCPGHDQMLSISQFSFPTHICTYTRMVV